PPSSLSTLPRPDCYLSAFDIPAPLGISSILHYERSGFRPGSATWDGHPRCPLALEERGCGRPLVTIKCPERKARLVMPREPGFFVFCPQEERDFSDPLFDVPVPPRPADLAERTARLHAALQSRVLVLDGATGTALQAAALTAEHLGGAELERCTGDLCVT